MCAVKPGSSRRERWARPARPALCSADGRCRVQVSDVLWSSPASFPDLHADTLRLLEPHVPSVREPEDAVVGQSVLGLAVKTGVLASKSEPRRRRAARTHARARGAHPVGTQTRASGW